MDSAKLAERLEKARRSVAQGDAQIQRQRDLIARMKAAGKNTSKAHTVLKALTKRQADRLETLGHVMRQFPPE